MFIKSLFDRGASLFGLIFLFPVLIIISILIRIKMPGGPVIFKQKRVGQYGRLFTMYKFRSMTVAHSGSSISVKGESRITPLGAVLRKYKLDELPELWNVLIGDMSFVGLVPMFPVMLIGLRGSIGEYSLKTRHYRYASLKYRNEEELLAEQKEPQKYNDEFLFPDKVRINIEYLDSWSFWNDIKIIIYTVLGKDL